MNNISDDTEDEWYYDSIKRYGKLIMFEVENSIQQIELCDSSSICALSTRKSGQNVLSEFSLPLKLRVNLGDGLVKDCDMKIKSGVFLDSVTTQIVTLCEQKKVLLSQEDMNGVSVYSLNSDGTDQISNSGSLDFPLTNPKLALNCDRLAATKDTSQISVVVDISRGKLFYTVGEFKISNSCDKTLPVFISNDVLGLCEESNGTVHFYDLRRTTRHAILEGHKKDDSKWAVSTNCSTKNPAEGISGREIGLLSGSGVMRLFDMRDLRKPILDTNLGRSDARGRQQLCFNPSDTNLLSVSGLDASVYVYDYKNELRLLFTHDGHVHTEACDKETVTTSHLWYEPGGPNMIISGALNCSINCWQYNCKV